MTLEEAIEYCMENKRDGSEVEILIHVTVATHSSDKHQNSLDVQTDSEFIKEQERHREEFDC